MLTLRQAAAYCQITEQLFVATCPVEPVRLGGRESQQARRWDRALIDRWLDSLNPARERPTAGGLGRIYADDDEAETRPAH